MNKDFSMKITPDLKSTAIHLIAGFAIGFVSSALVSRFLSVVMMVVVLIATGQLVQRVFKLQPKITKDGVEKYDFKWWLGNGVWPYFTFWLLSWILFYNL